MPLGCGSGWRTFTPLCRRWVKGRRLCRAAAMRIRRTPGPLDPLVAWQLPVLLHLGCGLIPLWLLLGVTCTGRGVCVTRFVCGSCDRDTSQD